MGGEVVSTKICVTHTHGFRVVSNMCVHASPQLLIMTCIAMSAEWVTRGSHHSYKGDTYWSTFKTMNTQNLNLRKRERRVCVEWSNKRKICFPNNRLPRKEMCELHQFTSITTLKHHLFMSLPYNIYHHHWGDCCCDLALSKTELKWICGLDFWSLELSVASHHEGGRGRNTAFSGPP